MRKTLFNKSDLLKIFIIGILFSAASTCLRFPTGLEDLIPTLEEAFFSIRDGHVPQLMLELEREHLKYNGEPFESYFHIMLFIPLILNILMADFETAKGFVFIRISNVFKWYKYKLIQSSVYCFITALIYNSTIMLMLIGMGYRAQSSEKALKDLITSILVGFLFLFITVSLAQIFSFRMPVYLASIVVIIIVILGTFSILYLPESTIQYNIISHYFVSWFSIYPYYERVHDFPCQMYYIAIMLIAAIEIAAGKRILQKSDML